MRLPLLPAVLVMLLLAASDAAADPGAVPTGGLFVVDGRFVSRAEFVARLNAANAHAAAPAAVVRAPGGVFYPAAVPATLPGLPPTACPNGRCPNVR